MVQILLQRVQPIRDLEPMLMAILETIKSNVFHMMLLVLIIATYKNSFFAVDTKTAQEQPLGI